MTTGGAQPSDWLAILHGTVDPSGEETTAWFEWGRTPELGSATTPQIVHPGGNAEFGDVIYNLESFERLLLPFGRRERDGQNVRRDGRLPHPRHRPPPPQPPPPPSPPPERPGCLVPKVVGRPLAKAKKLIRKAGCRVGARSEGALGPRRSEPFSHRLRGEADASRSGLTSAWSSAEVAARRENSLLNVAVRAAAVRPSSPRPRGGSGADRGGGCRGAPRTRRSPGRGESRPSAAGGARSSGWAASNSAYAGRAPPATRSARSVVDTQAEIWLARGLVSQ